MRIKIDRADQAFSLYIRELADWRCKRCGRQYDRDEPNQLQNSHYFSRSFESTRFDPDNCDALCFGCHNYWGSNDKEGYRDYLIAKLGEDGFRNLKIKALVTKIRKDRKMSLLTWRLAYRALCEQKRVIPRVI